MIYPATDLARGWLSVGHASSKDKWAPALNRTLSLEEHPGGLRLTATDSYMVLTTFVPGVEHDTTEEPDADEAPIQHAVAIDADGRGAGFMKFIASLAVEYHKAGEEPPEVKVRLNVRNPSGSGPGSQLPGMSRLMVTLEAADVERVDLPTYEGEYPPWQGIVERAGALMDEPTRRLALHPDRVAAMAKVAGEQGGLMIGWTFGGEHGPARVEILESEPYVHGAVMPVRWDLWRDAPRVDNPEAPPAEPEGDTET